MLQACSTAELRARGALEFLRAYSGAEAGFLYLFRGSGLQLVSGASSEEAPPDLLAEAERVWNKETESQDDVDATLELAEIEAMQKGKDGPFWLSERGEIYHRFLLHTHYRGRWCPLGVVALKQATSDRLPLIGRRHVDAICAALLQSGDVSPASVP